MKTTKNLILIFAFATVLSACAGASQQETKSLYERLGGKEAITAVVTHLWGVASKDERINQYFADTQPDVFGTQLIDFLCQGSGGPCTYSGQNMADAHRTMGVTSAAFDALADDIVITLNHFKVPEKEQSEVMAMLGAMQGDVVTK